MIDFSIVGDSDIGRALKCKMRVRFGEIRRCGRFKPNSVMVSRPDMSDLLRHLKYENSRLGISGSGDVFFRGLLVFASGGYFGGPLFLELPDAFMASKKFVYEGSR